MTFENHSCSLPSHCHVAETVRGLKKQLFEVNVSESRPFAPQNKKALVPIRDQRFGVPWHWNGKPFQCSVQAQP